MTPERAHSRLSPLSVTADDLAIRCRADKYGGKWVVFARLGDEEAPVTQGDIYGLCQWVRRFASLDALAAALSRENS